MSVWTSPRIARMVPSRAQATSRIASSSRAWFIAIRFSRRSSIHFTGRLTWRAANGIRKSSGIELAARAVAAADVVLDHLDLLDRQADLRRQDPAVEERHLGRAIDRELALGLVPRRHDAARLHGEAVVAAGAQPLAADVGRLGEGRVGVALARTGTPASGWCPASRTAGSCSACATVQSATGGRSSISTSMASSASSPTATLSASTTAIGSPT